MPNYRDRLPQLSGGIFLADAGVETDLIFNHGIAIREFAAHTLLPDPKGREALTTYFRSFLSLARETGSGFILDSQTWKAHAHWAKALGSNLDDLRQANVQSISFIAGLREEFASNNKPIVLNAALGPCGDAYSADTKSTARKAEEYHRRQIDWLAETEVDMLTATTFPDSGEAIGVVRAARKAGLPIVVSFTVETDGSLPTGQLLRDAIRMVDDATEAGAAYFMVNCAHPDHFFHVLENAEWAQRVRGLRCNASRKSHAELDRSDTLDAGNPKEFGEQHRTIRRKMPWLSVFGGCCGSDLRHVKQIAQAVTSN